MGTRADFYIGRGSDAEWIGSIAWDGDPASTFDEAMAKPVGAKDFRDKITAFLNERDDATLPEQGWPWSWDDSNTTDYAYCYDGGKVWGTGLDGWFDVALPEPEEIEDVDPWRSSPHYDFPDMSARRNMTLGKRSGVMVISQEGDI